MYAKNERLKDLYRIHYYEIVELLICWHDMKKLNTYLRKEKIISRFEHFSVNLFARLEKIQIFKLKYVTDKTESFIKHLWIDRILMN